MNRLLILFALMCFAAPAPAGPGQADQQDQPGKAEAQEPAPTTAPSTGTPWLRFPCQFTDEQHIWIDLLPRTDGGPGSFTGYISVGSRGSDRRFPIQGKFVGKTATAEFTDEDGLKFPCTLAMDGLNMDFKTGRTLYKLEKCPGGIGIGVDAVNNGFKITNVRPGYPAGNAGLREGDIIVAVDGKPLIDFEDSGIRGDVGTTVKLTVLRDDGSSHLFTLTRAPLELPNGGFMGRGVGGRPSQPDPADRNGRPGDSQDDPKDR